MGKTALFLGGGAPNFTLMAGALLALHQKGIRFDVVSMAGAGAVVGLLYLAPKSLTPEQSLENSVNFGISDEIYSFFPVNYKAFSKWGPAADAFNHYWFSLPPVQAAAHQYGQTPAEKLQSDWLLLLGAMLCPSDLTPADSGLCEHPFFIDNLIDFDNLRNVTQDIELNAFRLRDKKVVDFTKHEITADHLRATLSFPFIYPPYKIGDEYFYEGAAFQCINPSRVPASEIDHFVLLQPMATQQIRAPSNLWDAYAQSVMMPVAALAQYGRDAVERLAIPEMKPNLLEREVNELPASHVLKTFKEFGALSELFNKAIERISEIDTRDCHEPVPLSVLMPRLKKQNKWHEANFLIDEDRLPHVFEWSRSNLEYLFDLGYVTGEDLADDILNKP